MPGLILPTPSRWDRKDWIICVVLGVAALCLYCLGRNTEFQGDDDYLYPANFSMITDAIMGLKWGSFNELGSGLINLAGQIICAPRHAPLPAMLSAGFYAICDGLRIPFSLDLLHIPIAVVSTVSVLLLYGLLRRATGFSRIGCSVGALLLIISPIFVMVSRGVATYFLAYIPFTMLVGLWAIEALNREVVPRWWIGFALAQIVVSDVIWFVSLPLLLSAFVWWTLDRKTVMARLLSFKVLGPPIGAAVLLLLGTWVAYAKGLSSPLLKLLLEHGAKVGCDSPVISSPFFLVECLSLQLGVFLPLLIVIGLLIWGITGGRLRPGLMMSFGVLGGLSYGVIFYGLSPERIFVKHCYQIYLLVPLIFIVLSLVDLLRNHFRWGAVWASSAVIVLLVLEGAACVNFIWKVPISPFSDIFEGRTNGAMSANQGTKAAGYLVRQWIEAVWRQKPELPVVLYASRYTMSFAIFSGMNASEKGWVYNREFGPDRPVSVYAGLVLSRIPQLYDRTVPDFVYVLDFSKKMVSVAGVAARLADPDCLRYTLRSSCLPTKIIEIYIFPPEGLVTFPIPPGELNVEQLEARFDRQYNRYLDYFPRRLMR